MKNNRIAALRAQQGWTQAELAQLLGVQRSAVSNYEQGYPPARRVAVRFVELARGFGVRLTLEELYS